MAISRSIFKAYLGIHEDELCSSANASTSSRTSSACKERLCLEAVTIKEESRFIQVLSKLFGLSADKLVARTLGNVLCLRYGARQEIENPPSLNEKTHDFMPRVLRVIDRRFQGLELPPTISSHKIPTRISAKAVDLAGQNCRVAHVVIRTLQEVVTRLERNKAQTKCEWILGTHGGESESVEWYLQTESEMGPINYVHDSPQSLHQMVRMTTWACAEIEDEFRGLIIAGGLGGDEWREKKLKFTRRWGNEIQSYPSISIDHSEVKIKRDIDAKSFLAGRISADEGVSPWAYVMPYWDVLHRTFQEQSPSREIMNGKEMYDFDLNTVRGVLNETTSGRPVQKQVGERCARNVELVQGILCSFQVEIVDEIERRLTCKHAWLHKTHHSRTKTLKKALDILEKMGKKVGSIAETIQDMRLKRFTSDVDHFRTLADWGSLDGNAYKQLVGLTSDELVERLVDRPIPEDRVAEQDELVRGIETGMLPARTNVILLSRREEDRRAAERMVGRRPA